MSFFSNFTSKKRIRAALRRLGAEPSAENYVAVAREHVVVGNLQDILRVCSEGLSLHPGNAELMRIAERARQLQLDSRIRTLRQDLTLSPRPALWRELCDVLLECGRLQHAEETAEQWWNQAGGGESTFYRARARASQFFQGCRASDGKVAWDLALEAVREMPGDSRPLEVQYDISKAAGAWAEARKVLARILEISPGHPQHEQRFRDASQRVHDSKSLRAGLAEIEATGRFADSPEANGGQSNVAIRPLLKRMGADSDVKAVIFQRGGTALVQGLHGGTADRTARAVREVGVSTRSSARRIGIGRSLEVSVEGEFGSLVIALGTMGTAACWGRSYRKPEHADALQTIVGASKAGHATGGAA
ncbi:MAG: hypothetical protein H6830_00605 [Planctomycetes bacterium]|nr:hypothetical protein [Planctomycetota bacterium]MCB9911025.1 hypothetical protein [Planctomycetota bacterium]HPF14637.1 hypothetical protein [Planctomycetota bacterium]HRV82294.1 hypothetical protein [Planctomycetota bacterium]